ncbi:hypothetical protein D3C76_1137280 [compost metagenome]
MGTSVALKHQGQKVSYSLAELDTAREGLLEALRKSFQVERLALHHEGVDFKLTSDFHFKAIAFDEAPEREEAEEQDAVFMWQQEAAAQALQFSAVVNQLCDLLGYQAEEENAAAA